MRGKGMKDPRNPNIVGDQHVVVEVQIPKIYQMKKRNSSNNLKN